MTAQLRPQIADFCHLEPLPDPPPREPDMQQDIRIYDFRRILHLRLSRRGDVLIAGGGYLRRRAGDDSEIFVPDCVVAFGVNPRGITERNGYVIGEVGKPPDFVLEVGSRSTGTRDYTVKRDGNADYGVREYWRFDYTGGRYHDAALAGDTLVEGRYRPLPVHRDLDGLLWGYSEVLDVELCWDGGNLRLRDHDTKEFLRTPEEEQELREEEQRRREEEQRRREEEQRRREEEQRRREQEQQLREQEQRRREAAEERVRLLEAELRRRDGV